MSERALRGTRLGATSYETDDNIDLAPRQDIEYECGHGHRFRMPFSLEADVPAGWECRVCGAPAVRVDGAAPQDKPTKPVRTHWDMLLERRSLPELEDVLAERLEVLRSGGIGFAAALGQPDERREGGESAGGGVATATRPTLSPAGRAAKKPGVKKPVAKRPTRPAPSKQRTL
jgi:RNA polymerase-binding protein